MHLKTSDFNQYFNLNDRFGICYHLLIFKNPDNVVYFSNPLQRLAKGNNIKLEFQSENQTIVPLFSHQDAACGAPAMLLCWAVQEHEEMDAVLQRGSWGWVKTIKTLLAKQSERSFLQVWNVSVMMHHAMKIYTRGRSSSRLICPCVRF